MTDQLIIGDKASFDDYEASLATRNIGMPTKKSIKETVPFSNVTYDFSAIGGELYWEERELEYVFEIIAATPEKLEELKTAFASWVMNVQGEEIHDPFIPDYHFVGTFDDIEFDDEESLDKTTVSVTFKAYPYKIANLPRVFEKVYPAGNINATFYIENNSSHRIFPKITFVSDNPSADNGLPIDVVNDISIAATTIGGTINGEFALPQGVSTMSVHMFDPIVKTMGNITVTISFYEEVF